MRTRCLCRAMRAVRSPTLNTASPADGTTTPAGTGASTNVTIPRGSGSTSRVAAGSHTGTRFAAAVPKDSSSGIFSSVKVSSSASRAPRSGTANTMLARSFTSWRMRPSSFASLPAMDGWRTSSSASACPPTRAMDEKLSRCCLPKSICRGFVNSPCVLAWALRAADSTSSVACMQSSNRARGSASTTSASALMWSMGEELPP